MSKLRDVLAAISTAGDMQAAASGHLPTGFVQGDLVWALEDARALLQECLAFVGAFSGYYQASHDLREIHPNHADTLTKLLHALGRSEDEIKRALGR